MIGYNGHSWKNWTVCQAFTQEAAQSRKTIVVPDVREFVGHIACDPLSRSEIVVPLLTEKKLIGVLDLDSARLNRFDQSDSRGLSEVAKLLVRSSGTPKT